MEDEEKMHKRYLQIERDLAMLANLNKSRLWDSRWRDRGNDSGRDELVRIWILSVLDQCLLTHKQ